MTRIAFAHTTYRKAIAARRDFNRYGLLAAVARDGKIARLDLHVPDHWTDGEARTAYNRRIPDVFVEIRHLKASA